MKTITEQQAQQEFADLLAQTAENDIIIEKDGKPAAVLISYDEYLCYEELAEEMNMLEYLVSEIDDEENDKVGDREIKEFLHIEREE